MSGEVLVLLALIAGATACVVSGHDNAAGGFAFAAAALFLL